MARNILIVVLAVLTFYCVECADPAPKVEGSFIAYGEIVQPVESGSDSILQMTFEESFDADSKNAIFLLRFGGRNLTFAKSHLAKQTFLYIETDDKKLNCKETSEQEWIQSDFESSLLSFEDDEGMVKFSLKQLFDLPQKYLVDGQQGVKTTYRGIAAKSWKYKASVKNPDTVNANTVTITSYWTDGTVSTSAGKNIIPLGFNVSKTSDKNPQEDYIVSIYGFVPGTYDKKHFKPIEGVYCVNRVETLKFPSIKDIRAISLHSEMILPDYQEIRYIDTYFDPISQLVRIDVERMKDEDPMERKVKHYQSEVAIGKMGVVYRLSYFNWAGSCEVIPFDKYENDLQNLFDVKQDLTRWKMGRIFGLNDTSYVYLGRAIKNDIPCHLFQGIRADWPDKSAGIKSLWEWCFNVDMSKNNAVMFQGDEFGLISAQINVMEASNTAYNNYRMNHHFYEVKSQDPKMLDATKFDIGMCYSDVQKKVLQFYLDVDLNLDNKMLAENTTSDIDFLQKWKAALYANSKLPSYSLRISNVRSTIEGDKMYIKFSILDVHKDLPEATKKGMTSADEAEKTLRENIDAGKLSVKHEWKKGEVITAAAVKSSLSYQIDPKFNPQTVAPIPSTAPTQSTLFPFSLRTEPPLKRITKYTGNQPGTVAGVSIAMLLVGITLGSFGTFYKYNGLPSFLRR